MKGKDLEKRFKQRYEKLNTAQKKAVDIVDGPVLVVAGPGSGKTEILSLRVANILKKTDAAPSNILCLTFTDSAAANMRTRLAEIIGADAYKVAIHTFHSFGLEIINRNPEFFYNGAHFIPADELARIRVIEEILKKTSYDNPLRSEHPDQGFVYTSAIVQAISDIKRAGLTPDEFLAILTHNKEEQEYINPLLAAVFDERISKTTFEKVEQLLSEIGSYPKKPFPLPHFNPWLKVVEGTLRRALSEARESGKSAPLSVWKSTYTKKNEKGERVHRDFFYSEKMFALANIYKEYRDKMYRLRFYDFDDMLLETIIALETHDTLRYGLQEQFHYVLVDEFQDTNDAQVRILKLISDAPVHEGKPNIMAVGDDDQAIYKFQGAEISNILYFKDFYHNPEIITMTENYRSTQMILDVARHVICKGEERLENTIPWLEKKLIAANPNIDEGDIIHKTFPTSAHELSFIAKEIKHLIKTGARPQDIAIIGRRHKELVSAAAYLSAQHIPLRYERQQNVLDEPHIHQIVTIAKFIATLCRKHIAEADNLLPEILSYPFWNIERKDVWGLSVAAHKRRREDGGEWMREMRDASSEKLRAIAQFFDELAAAAQTEPLEAVLDKIIGSHTQLIADSEEEDDEYTDRDTTDKEFTHSFISPFREFYFGKDKFRSNTVEYLTFLSGLRAFIHALREYKNGEKLTIDDLVEFVELHEKNDIAVIDTSPFAGSSDAVVLMTAHKAKGLEFETVFVLSCQDDIWASSLRPAKLSFPENLKITPAGDTLDDQIKLFYVAMTRAKRNLYLTSYTTKDSGRESVKLRFLNPHGAQDEHIAKIFEGEKDDTHQNNETALIDILERNYLTFHTPPFTKEEFTLLATLVEDYQMPVTHFNNFLDVTSGGPQTFLEQNLLRFPQSMTPSGAYGAAMHKTIELVYIYLKKYGELPDEKEVLEWFERELGMKRLSDNDFTLFLKRGKNALKTYYTKRKEYFNPLHKIEVDFKNQGVVVGGAPLTGKIDKIIEGEHDTLVVTDFKTGKATKEWKGKDPYEKIKLYKYKNQLIFYKLLIERSRDFHARRVEEGMLEFLEPTKAGEVVNLPLIITKEDAERMEKLIPAVYKKIVALDFPEIDTYEKTLAGIKAFEKDLIEGSI